MDCNETKFLCYDEQKCINITLRCDLQFDCDDYSDEKHCKLHTLIITDRVNGEKMFKTCI